MSRIAILGYIIRGPLGGLVWHHLQYVIGLRALGHDVLFVEDSDDYPSCYDPSRHAVDTDPSFGLRFAGDAFGRVNAGELWAYHDAHTGRWLGPAAGRAREFCESADLVLNLSGVNPLREWVAGAPVRALVDTDPAFTQIRHLSDPAARTRALEHTAFLTFGENFGRPGCSIPDDGLPWVPTRQPITLDAWEVTEGPESGPFTTVMQWDSYAPSEHGGRRFGMKSESFTGLLDLPSASPETFELALGTAGAPRGLLSAHGWRIRDPLELTKDASSYQRYIRSSKGELSAAKHGYVASRSGWFSERSACYLASGRPVAVQDTGFSEWMETGLGVAPFSTLEEAADAVARISGDYPRHCRAAREIAAHYFDSATVLPALIRAAEARK
ncbi:MAG: hypothetical protein QOH06_5117 [Acidobacteriota bacterium]|jgi:hypothetical protein|nr:hypothetical protein [Acidobacteriota bacterium]